MRPGFTFKVLRPDGYDTIYQPNLIVNQGAQSMMKRPALKPAFSGGRVWYLGMYTAGTITAGSTAQSLGVTEFTGYTVDGNSNQRIELVTSHVLDTGAETVTMTMENDLNEVDGVANIQSVALITGLFIVDDSGTLGALDTLWAGADLANPIAVGPGSVIQATYNAVFNIP